MAWHTGTGAVRLGTAWTADTASPRAADNTTDDGVARTAFTTSTGGVNLTVTGATGYVTGWFDWNQDGDFGDAGEQVFTNQAVAAGNTVPVSFSTNGNSVYNKTFNARFRVYAATHTRWVRTRRHWPSAAWQTARWRTTPGTSRRWRWTWLSSLSRRRQTG